MTFTRTTAPLGEGATGSLIWSGGGGHTVRTPIALEDFEVAPGFTGTLNTTLHGLVGVAPVAGS